jgi:hypothetical protein
VLAVLATAVGVAALAEARTAVVPKPRVPGATGFPGGPYFLTLCATSHRSNDDPIAHPGKRGASHSHTFFGNRETDAHSTPDALAGGRSSCGTRGDASAYWIPTLFADGDPLRPLVALVHYVRTIVDPVRTFPQGLRMIAGEADARRPQSTRATYWTCGAQDGRRRRTSAPTCAAGEFLNLHVTFPSCWDGRRLDSADHKSHMSYPVNERCPRTHPVGVPTIVLVVVFADPGGGRVLASGRFGGHADFMNAWDPEALAPLVAAINSAP